MIHLISTRDLLLPSHSPSLPSPGQDCLCLPSKCAYVLYVMRFYLRLKLDSLPFRTVAKVLMASPPFNNSLLDAPRQALTSTHTETSTTHSLTHTHIQRNKSGLKSGGSWI